MVNTLVLKIVLDGLLLKVDNVLIHVVNTIISLEMKVMKVMLNITVVLTVVIMHLRMVLPLLKLLMKIQSIVFQHVQVNIYMILQRFILKNQKMVEVLVVLHIMNVYLNVQKDIIFIYNHNVVTVLLVIML